jgi:hypothetical protein
MPDSSVPNLRTDDRFLAIQADFEELFERLTYYFHFDDDLDWDAAVDQVAGRLERLIQSASGPAFDVDGYVPPIQRCTEAEVARWFGVNPHRQRLLQRVRNWISLARAVKARRLLLDGSFVTAKEEPGDVDAVVLLPEDFADQLRVGNRKAVELLGMFLTREPKELFAAEDEEGWWGWFEFFSRTREATGRRKGLIEVAL